MNIDELDEQYMRRCIELARYGRMHAQPNPMVGAVIVGEGRIIGEGYHAVCGQSHAEVNAIASVRPEDRPLLKESTIYVSLEPCAHFGRTPPCARLLVQTGVKRCVVGCIDPFAKVQGRGISMLREAGIGVRAGVLEKECRELNRRFITAQTQHRPYITLKWAQSADGFIDRWREEDSDEQPARLSSPFTQMRAHQLRAMHQAILVGHSTLRLDHPRLNLRAWTGNAPRPVVLGRVAEGELPAGWLAYADIETALSELYHAEGLQSLLVEGGAQTLQGFIDRGLWDEAWAELSPIRLESGVPAPRMPMGVTVTPTTFYATPYLHYDAETMQR